MASKPVGRDAPAGADGRRWLLHPLIAMLLLAPMDDSRRWRLNLLITMLLLAPKAAMPCRKGYPTYARFGCSGCPFKVVAPVGGRSAC